MYFKSEKGLLDSHTWRVVGEESQWRGGKTSRSKFMAAAALL